MHTLLLSFGSNLGKREYYLSTAYDLLCRAFGTTGTASDFYESEPVGFASDHRFLNFAARFACSAPLDEVFRLCHAVEQQLGRTEKSHDGRYTDRTIDIDLLAWDDIVIQTPKLTLPHPRLAERRFVLEPLAAIAGELRHPTSGLTYTELLGRLNEKSLTALPDSAPRPCRQLRAEDCTPHQTETVNELLTQLSPGKKRLGHEDLLGLLGNELFRLIVVTDKHDEITGMATLFITPLVSGTKGRIEDVVVDERHRGKGLARRLLVNLLNIAAEEGVESLELTSRPTRKAANALYRDMGFTPRETNVYGVTHDAITKWSITRPTHIGH